MPNITSQADIAGKDDQVVRVIGVYAVQDLGRYRIVSELADGTELQSNKLSYLELEDGSQVRLGARPESELELADQKVAATGTFKESWPPPDDPKVAQSDASPTLLKILSVEPLR